MTGRSERRTSRGRRVADASSPLAGQLTGIQSENARLMARLDETERRFRRISRGVLKMQEDERGRFSRDLHDGIGQSLTALKIQLELLERDAAQGPLDLLRRLAGAREIAEGCLAEVRQLAHLMRPQMLDELGLVPTLRWLVRTFQQRSGVAVELVSPAIDERLEADLETLVYRLVQEALTNVVKHAHTPSARVSLTADDRCVLLSVEDRGSGFDVARALQDVDDPGFGLRGMRDRVQFFGGRFTLRSAPGEGTTILAEIPRMRDV